MIDLNERVQARLAELKSIAGTFQHDLRDPQHQLMWFLPEYGLEMVESWRTRWDRHQPVESCWGSTVGELVCPICQPHGRDVRSLCDEQLSVLYEIGVTR